MKVFFTLSCFLLLSLSIVGQERTVTGRLTSSDDGSPLPGVNITIKGTAIGTATDADGNYSIRVPIGATLVFSFIGLQSREVIVTETNLQPVTSSKSEKKEKRKTQPTNLPRSLFRDSVTTQKKGMAIITDKTPRHSMNVNIDPASVWAIKKRGNKYFIKTLTAPNKSTGFGLQFTSSLGLENVNKLPSFQNRFAQGQPAGGSLQWQGAHQQEIFSWGPLVRTLEFDGSNYSFDKNGMLVPAGTGNGKAAKKYDANSFFKTGFTFVNEILLTVPAPNYGAFLFDLEYRTRTGIIPNSDYKKLNVSTSLKDYRISKSLATTASVSFNQSIGNLLTRGGNAASIIGSVYRTPITFDNTNELSPRSAIRETKSYQLTDGSIRSHAPGIADNPFGLANTLPDHELLKRLVGTVNLRYYPEGSFDMTVNSSVDWQESDNTFGIAPGYSGYTDGRLTRRNDRQTFANLSVIPSHRGYFFDADLITKLSYQAQYFKRELTRDDGFQFIEDDFGAVNRGDSLTAINNQRSRNTHEITLDANLDLYQWLHVRISNKVYFSNTVKANQYTNAFPSFSASIDFAQLNYLYEFSELKIYASASRTIRESPLLYTNWSYGSTQMPVENYNSFYESTELFPSRNIAPETERKFETGLNVKVFSSRLSLDVTYYNNLTRDFITPQWNVNKFVLQNSATVRNYGTSIEAGYMGYQYDGLQWGIDLRWNYYNSVVEEIYGNENRIPLSGFESIQSVLKRDESVGAIYGTTYQRNSQGKKVIGSDGFPLENPALKKIGNPIPDWTLGWSSYIKWKQFGFSFVVDFKKGGDVWNGTNAALDYLGLSSETGKKRNTSNYIFNGVDVNNDPNTIPVSFADPSQPVTQNRWVRYGWDGVGEDSIEDASWIRLNELVFSYTAKWSGSSRVKEMKLSLIGRNLLLITPYSGADPSSNLFGYSTGTGLDLFNTPSTRSFSAQVTFKL